MGPQAFQHYRRRNSHARRLEVLEPRWLLAAAVVINELHVDPADKTQPVEFIELHNAGDTDADLSGWQFTDGVQYTFPPGSTLPAGGYVVVGLDPAAIQSAYGVSAFGPFTGKLSNEGELLVLVDDTGTEQDRVDYGLGFPWPIVGDDRDFSMELVHPSLDNDLGGSWRASVGSPGNNEVLVDAESLWKYHEGTSEPSNPVAAWRNVSFHDAAWTTAPTSIGYGENFLATTLNMRGNFTTLYLRKEFTVVDPVAVNELLLELQYDDGINVWINGTHVAGANVPANEIPHTGTASRAIENVNFVPFTLVNPGSYLFAGTNVIAVQLLNASLSGSSDAFFDARLTARTGSQAGLTPGGANSVFANNAGPQMRQVDHSPSRPITGEEVVVTIKATDPDGIGSLWLEYQVVEPGDYIGESDPRYETNWTTIAMRDDGTSGDAVAGDDTFTAVIPGSAQQHRRLIRYRINADDTLGNTSQAPYANDPVPNFAYFVYDAIPAWTGRATPNAPDVTYSGDLLDQVQTYHLLTTSQSHEESQYIPDSSSGTYRGSDYLWEGTLVYKGEVYDHINYRARGGVWRYAMGKNMWKFDFQRGHYFQARDDYGKPYGTAWDKLNFSALIQQGNFLHRGEQGLFESVGFELFNLAGVEAPNTHYVNFRLITQADENGTDQFSGDFQGLYLAIEQPDGRMLEEHDLPDGNFYKMEGGTGTLNNQGPTQPSDRSDLNAFLDTYNGTTPDEQWWRDNLDLARYYSYRSIVEGIHHYDIAGGKNYYYFHNPETGKWQVHPWDLDLTWANNMFGSGNEPFKSRVAHDPRFRVEYMNRLRELRDLLYNAEQTGMLIDSKAAIVYQPGELSPVHADRAMWDYNPILASGYVNGSKAGHGKFYEQSGNGNFGGMIELMKNYVDSRGTWIDNTLLINETDIPVTPLISYNGPAGFPIDNLRFQTTGFQSPSGESFAGMEWRVAEVTDPSATGFNPYDRTQGRKYEITSTWESGERNVFSSGTLVTSSELKPGETYRARVRMKDSAGQWSHWSAPVQFVAGAPISPLATGLRITELHYHPADPTAEELANQAQNEPPWTADDFEFIELRNTATVPVQLAGVRFDEGVAFDFGTGAITTLAPNDYVVIVSNQAAFEARYGSDLPIAGEYNGQLNNGGEEIDLVADLGGELLEFDYDDDGDWPARADGLGASLEIVDTTLDYNDADSWRSSKEYHGSPGVTGSGPFESIVINEVLTYTEAPRREAIELTNVSIDAIDLSGWYLSNTAGDYRKYQFPAGTILAAGEYRVFDEEDFNGSGTSADFSFAGTSGELWLMAADSQDRLTRFVDDVDFDAAVLHEAFARWPDGSGRLMPAATLTLGSENVGPRIGPLIISELMYHPAGQSTGQEVDHLEFVEIHNTLESAIDLSDWKVEGFSFTFPAGASLAGESTLVVVPFDPSSPTDASLRTDFLSTYNLDPGVTLFGPAAGKLDNGGERVALLRPTPASIDFIVIDEVRYRDIGPWPQAADGFGDSLSRQHCAASGNDSVNWQATAATPGTATCMQLGTVVGRHTFYNESAFDGFDPTANANDDAAIAVDKSPLLPGSAATFASYTSHPAGVTGVMIDIAGLSRPDQVSPDQFLIRLGHDSIADTWEDTLKPGSVSVRTGAGLASSDRVTLLFAAGTVTNTWLQVIVLPGADTGLPDADVFYFGNAVADTGDSPNEALVNASDFAAIRSRRRGFLNVASIDDPLDLNRDRRVNAIDLLVVRDHATGVAGGLSLIDTLPEAGSPVGVVQKASGGFGGFELPSKKERPAESNSKARSVIDHVCPVSSAESDWQGAVLHAIAAEQDRCSITAGEGPNVDDTIGRVDDFFADLVTLTETQDGTSTK